jgi:hypothetical protein
MLPASELSGLSVSAEFKRARRGAKLTAKKSEPFVWFFGIAHATDNTIRSLGMKFWFPAFFRIFTAVRCHNIVPAIPGPVVAAEARSSGERSRNEVI